MSEDRSTDNPDSQRVIEALNTIARAVVGKDLDGIRASVTELDSKQSERIESLNERASTAVSELKEDLLSRLEGLGRKMAESAESRKEETHSRFEEFDRRIAESKASQHEAINEFEKTLRETAGDLREKMKQAREQAENGVGAVRTALEHELAGREATQEQLGSLTREVAELQEKLQQQLETSERLSGVLNSLAGVFSAQLASRIPPEKSESKAPRAEDRAEPAERSSSASDSGQDSSGSGARELDNALNRLFQDS